MITEVSSFYFQIIRVLPVIPNCMNNNFIFSDLVINDVMAGNQTSHIFKVCLKPYIGELF